MSHPIIENIAGRYEIDADTAAKLAAQRVAQCIRAQLAPFKLSRHPIRFDGGDLQVGGLYWFELRQRSPVGRVLWQLGETCGNLPKPIQQHLAKEFT